MPRSGEGAQRVRRAGEGLEERRPAVGDGKWELRTGEGKGWGGEECGGKGWRRERRQGGRALGLRGRVPAGAEGGARGKVERGASGGGVELGGRGGGLLRGRELVSALLSLNRKCPAECVCVALPRRDRVPDCRSVGSVWEPAALPPLSTLIPLGSTQTRTPPRPPPILDPPREPGPLGAVRRARRRPVWAPVPAKNVTFEVEIGMGALNQVTWEKAGLARRRRG